MTQDELFQQITSLVNEINKDDVALRQKRDRLRALSRQWAGGDRQDPKVAGTVQRRPGKRPKQVNISEVVRAYLARHPNGVKVPQFLDALNLRSHEATVRAALKREKKLGRAVNVNGVWAPVPANAKGPEPSSPEPQPQDFSWDLSNA